VDVSSLTATMRTRSRRSGRGSIASSCRSTLLFADDPLAHRLEYDSKERRPVIGSIYWFLGMFTIVNVLIAWIVVCIVVFVILVEYCCHYVVRHSDEDSDDVELFSLHFDRQSVSLSCVI